MCAERAHTNAGGTRATGDTAGEWVAKYLATAKSLSFIMLIHFRYARNCRIYLK